MDDTQSRPSTATRKRRSSILKSQRAPRTPFSELEFNVATPTDTGKSRRVSFSRRTGVAEFATNEATTSWKNFYEEQNRSLETSNQDHDAHQPRSSQASLGNRLFEQQFQDVEAEIDIVGTLGPPLGVNIENSMNAGLTQQIAMLDATTDGKITVPHKSFDLSAFTENTNGKMFKDDLTNPVNNEPSGAIDINFSNIHSIASNPGGNDDLDEIVRDLEISRPQVVGPSFGDCSQYIEVDLNTTHAHVMPSNDSDMSITDTIHSPKKELSKSISLNTKLNEDWVVDKENIVVNPYVASAETELIRKKESAEKILVFDGKKLQYADIDADIDDVVKSKSKSNVSEHNKGQKKSVDMSLTKVSTTTKRQTIVYDKDGADDGNLSLTQGIPDPIQMKSLVNEQKAGIKRQTIVFDKNDEAADISLTQSIPQVIEFNLRTENNAETKRRTIVFANDDIEADISMTQCIPNQIKVVSQLESPNKDKTKRQTIVFDNDIDADISMTQCIPNRLEIETLLKSPDEKIKSQEGIRNTVTKVINIVANKTFNNEEQLKDSAPTNLGEDLINKSTVTQVEKAKRQTIVFENEFGDISMTECIPNSLVDNINKEVVNKQKRNTIVFNDMDGEGDVSMTQCVSKSIVEALNNRTVDIPVYPVSVVFEKDEKVKSLMATSNSIVVPNHKDSESELRTPELSLKLSSQEFFDAKSIIESVDSGLNLPSTLARELKFDAENNDVLKEKEDDYIATSDFKAIASTEIIAQSGQNSKEWNDILEETEENCIATSDLEAVASTEIIAQSGKNSKENITKNSKVNKGFHEEISIQNEPTNNDETTEILNVKKAICEEKQSIKSSNESMLMIVRDSDEKMFGDLNKIPENCIATTDLDTVASTEIITQSHENSKENIAKNSHFDTDLQEEKSIENEPNNSNEAIEIPNVKKAICEEKQSIKSSNESMLMIIRDSDDKMSSELKNIPENVSVVSHSNNSSVQSSGNNVFMVEAPSAMSYDLPSAATSIDKCSEAVSNIGTNVEPKNATHKASDKDTTVVNNPEDISNKTIDCIEVKKTKDAATSNLSTRQSLVNSTRRILEMISSLTDEPEEKTSPTDSEYDSSFVVQKVDTCDRGLSNIMNIRRDQNRATNTKKLRIQTDIEMIEPSSPLHIPKRKSVRMNNDIIKTLNFDNESTLPESSRSPNKSVVKKSALKKTSILAKSFDNNSDSDDVPVKLKLIPNFEVTDSLKELMRDLVKPSADSGDTKDQEYNTCKKNSKIQANLLSSSQIEISVDLTTANSNFEVRLQDLEEERRNAMEDTSSYTTIDSDVSSMEKRDMQARVRFENYERQRTSPHIVNETQSNPVLIFDPQNPLNNILINPGSTQVHGYSPVTKSEGLDITNKNRRKSATNKFNVERMQIDIDCKPIPVDYEMPSSNSNTKRRTNEVDDQYRSNSTVTELKDVDVNTIIAMKGNNDLLAGHPSLTILKQPSKDSLSPSSKEENKDISEQTSARKVISYGDTKNQESNTMVTEKVKIVIDLNEPYKDKTLDIGSTEAFEMGNKDVSVIRNDETSIIRKKKASGSINNIALDMRTSDAINICNSDAFDMKDNEDFENKIAREIEEKCDQSINARKRSYSPTKYDNNYQRPDTELTPKPVTKSSKRSISPVKTLIDIVPISEQIAKSDRDIYQCNDLIEQRLLLSTKRHQVGQNSKVKEVDKEDQLKDSETIQTKPKTDVLVNQLIIEAAQKQANEVYNSSTLGKCELTKSETIADAVFNSKNFGKSELGNEKAVLESSDDSDQDAIGDHDTSSTKADKLSQISEEMDKLSHISEEMIGESETVSKLESEIKQMVLFRSASFDLMKRIDKLPFMNTRACYYERSPDGLYFWLLQRRIRLHVTLAPGLLTQHTKVTALHLDNYTDEKPSILGKLCIQYCTAAIEDVIATYGSTGLRAAGLPGVLSKCVSTSRAALQFGRTMHRTKYELAYSIDEDGNVALKVANIPLHSVWEVSLRICLKKNMGTSGRDSALCPHAADVRVTKVVSRVSLLRGEAMRVVAALPHDWGHVPRTIWKLFRYLKTRKADPILT